MANPWQIRRALAADAIAIAEAEARCFSDPWSVASIHGLFDNPLVFGLVGEWTAWIEPPNRRPVLPNGTLAGYLFARWVVDQAEVVNLAVVPEARQLGLGGQLLDVGLDELDRMGMSEVFLEVRESNAVAQALYQRRGFRAAGFRADYYRNPREGALVLRREGPPAAKR